LRGRRDTTAQLALAGSIPVSLTSFVGRERELREIRQLLDTARLLTLTGPGGVVKTRLAQEVARAFQNTSQHHVAFAELAPLEDASLIAHAVVASIGVGERPSESPLDTLVAAIGVRPLLLVLDNCEHLISAAAILTNRLLQACAGLRIVATSREPLAIGGESIWRVPPMSVPEVGLKPTADSVLRTDAARLFLDRAKAALPDFALTEQNVMDLVRVCRRLDGVPLALELAAASLSVLSVQQIADRLDDALGLLVRGSRVAPRRQQTLRLTLNWSYAMLSPAEQLLFDRLSAFAGSWALEAVEFVCSDPEDVVSRPGAKPVWISQILNLISRLVDKSLVLAERRADDSVRYRMLEVVRQYGRERLNERGQTADVFERHAQFYQALAERIEPELMGSMGRAALDRLERDHDNIRTALRHLLENQDIDGGQLLAGALGRFWLLRGYFSEGEDWLHRILALPGAEARTGGRARCLYVLASLQLNRGDYSAAEMADREALSIWLESGDAAGESWALFGLGQLARLRGEYAAARELLSDGVVASRTGGQVVAEVNCLNALADVAFDQSDDAEARAQAKAALERSAASGWSIGVSNAQRILGQLRAAQGDYAAAKTLFEASLSMSTELRWERGSILTLARLGELAIDLGEFDAARRWLTETLTYACDIGERPAIARALEGCACFAAVLGQPALALRLVAAAAHKRSESHAPLSPRDRTALEQRLASARAQPGPAAYGDASGEVWSTDEAIQTAFGLLNGAVAPTPDRELADGLSAREREVALLVARGLSNPQIAAELIIGERTVQTHVSHILTKLGLSSRVQVAGWVTEQYPTRHLRRDQ
jgi:non-specific serine/threonine protein kinase